MLREGSRKAARMPTLVARVPWFWNTLTLLHVLITSVHALSGIPEGNLIRMYMIFFQTYRMGF